MNMLNILLCTGWVKSLHPPSTAKTVIDRAISFGTHVVGSNLISNNWSAYIINIFNFMKEQL